MTLSNGLLQFDRILECPNRKVGRLRELVIDQAELVQATRQFPLAIRPRALLHVEKLSLHGTGLQVLRFRKTIFPQITCEHVAQGKIRPGKLPLAGMIRRKLVVQFFQDANDHGVFPCRPFTSVDRSQIREDQRELEPIFGSSRIGGE